MLPGAGGQPEPACDEHAQHVSVREQRDVTLYGARPGDYPIGSRRDLLRRFAARAAIPEDQPARRLFMNFLEGQPLVVPVIPLDEVGLDDRLADPGSLTRFARPLQRADEHQREHPTAQRRAQELDEPAPVVGQGDVRRARVATIQAPLSLPVSDRKHAHGNRSTAFLRPPRISMACACDHFLAGRSAHCGGDDVSRERTRTTSAPFSVPTPEGCHADAVACRPTYAPKPSVETC